MKRLLLFFCGLFLYTICLADTVNLTWKDGDTTYEKTTCTIGGDLNVPATQPTKYGYDFIGWKAKAAKELEYAKFQSNDELSYIDTGIMFDSNEIEYEIKAQFANNYAILFGAEGTCSGSTKVSNSSGSILNTAYTRKYIFKAGTATIEGKEESSSTNTYSLYINKTNKNVIGTVNGDVYNTTLTGTVTADKHIWLGGAGQGKHCNFYGSIYYFKIKKDGILVRDFVPVLDPDGVVCFYDKVTKEFFYNRNGPSLIAGPVKE